MTDRTSRTASASSKRANELAIWIVAMLSGEHEGRKSTNTDLGPGARNVRSFTRAAVNLAPFQKFSAPSP